MRQNGWDDCGDGSDERDPCQVLADKGVDPYAMESGGLNWTRLQNVADHWFDKHNLDNVSSNATEVADALILCYEQDNRLTEMLNHEDTTGQNALCIVATKVWYNQAWTARRLLKAGMDINSDCRDGNNVLGTAARGNRANLIQVLLDAGADVNHANDEGMTPLLSAADYNSLEVIKLLLAAGANTTAVDNNSDGLLYHAQQNSEVLTYLQDNNLV